MKSRLLIITALVITLGSSIFYLYLYYPSSYNEGIGVMISEDPEMVSSFNNKYPVYLLQEEDYGEIPKIKYMMDVLLTRDKTIGEKRIVHHGPDNVRYGIRAISFSDLDNFSDKKCHNEFYNKLINFRGEIVCVSSNSVLTLIERGYFQPISLTFDKTVIFPEDVGYDMGQQPDWGWEFATEQKKQEINMLQNKIMKEDILPIQGLHSLILLDSLVIMIDPTIQNEFTNNEIAQILQNYTNMTMFVEFDISENHSKELG